MAYSKPARTAAPLPRAEPVGSLAEDAADEAERRDGYG